MTQRPPDATRLPARAPRVAVVVIHGVSDQASGDTAALLSRRLADPTGLRASARERWRLLSPRLPAGPQPLEHLNELPLGAPFRTFSLEGLHIRGLRPRLDLWDVAWADLSRPGHSIVAIARALFGLVVALPGIGLAELAAAQRTLPVDASAIARWLARATFVAKAVMLPAFLMGLVIALSFAALPTSDERAENIWRVLALAHLVLPIALVPFLGMEHAGPEAIDGKPTPWAASFVATLAGLSLAMATYFARGPWTVFVPALELVAAGTLAVALGLGQFMTTEREVQTVRTVAGGIGGLWLVTSVMSWLTSHSTDVSVIACHLVYSTAWCTEMAYVVASFSFALSVTLVLVGLWPARRLMRGVVGTTAADRAASSVATQTMRTVAMAHALPLVLLLFTALPVLSGLLNLLESNHLLPDVPVHLLVLGSLEHFAGKAAHDEHLRLHVPGFLGALVRASGTHLLVVAVAIIAVVLAITVFVAIPPARAELMGGSSDDHHRLERWLERGTYVVIDWLRNGAIAIAAICLVGYALEVGVWLAAFSTHFASAISGVRDSWIDARKWATAAFDLPPIDLWHELAEGSGTLVIGLGTAVFGSAALAALPTRARELLQPLWPVLDVALDVTRYLDDPTRAKILGRAHAILSRVLDDDRYDAVVIVSHSQGTLIAADVLRSTAEQRRSASTPKEIHLVTMGSPLANLYHRLLPASFDWVKTALTSKAYLGVASWTNLYGGGDAVGRTVRDTELMRVVRELGPEPSKKREADDRANWVREVNVGSIGHTTYWDEGGKAGARVGKEIRRVLRMGVGKAD